MRNISKEIALCNFFRNILGLIFSKYFEIFLEPGNQAKLGSVTWIIPRAHCSKFSKYFDDVQNYVLQNQIRSLFIFFSLFIIDLLFSFTLFFRIFLHFFFSFFFFLLFFFFFFFFFFLENYFFFNANIYFSCLESFQVIAKNFETSCQFSVDFPEVFQWFSSLSAVLHRFSVCNFVSFQWVGSLSLRRSFCKSSSGFFSSFFSTYFCCFSVGRFFVSSSGGCVSLGR